METDLIITLTAQESTQLQRILLDIYKSSDQTVSKLAYNGLQILNPKIQIDFNNLTKGK
jgi:hypothetical protein